MVEGGDTAIYDSRGESVIGRGAFMRRGHAEAWANLRVAAAAPELLEACIGFRNAQSDEHWNAAVAACEAAIAKATGATP